MSLASDPLFVKNAFPILFAVNVSRSSLARSCMSQEVYSYDILAAMTTRIFIEFKHTKEGFVVRFQNE